MPVRWTRHALRDLLHARGIRLKKSLGQSFLVDENFLDALARDTGATKDDVVVEIGSGPGNLTDHLARRAAKVWAFDLDPRLVDLSRELLADRSNVTIVHADGAEFERHLSAEGRTLRVVSNLPYSDWKRLLLALLSTRLSVASYTVMVQTDVYDRLRAEPGTREYGSMAVVVQSACEMRRLRRAGKELFFPVPRVDSTVFEIVRKEVLDFTGLETRLRTLFAQRRKKSPAAGGKRIEKLAPSELLALARRGD
jgi:16S rRNA (adenine1518-N6/adenine1519-N6)-dimethyltransferase